MLKLGGASSLNIDKITEYFQSLGVPMAHANAYMVGTLEFTGGILLILGIASRVITLPLTINMLVAYHFGDPEALHAIFSEPGKFYGADPYTFLFASLLVLLFGAGVFSVDQLIGLAVRAKTQDARRAPLSVASRNETA